MQKRKKDIMWSAGDNNTRERAIRVAGDASK